MKYREYEMRHFVAQTDEQTKLLNDRMNADELFMNMNYLYIRINERVWFTESRESIISEFETSGNIIQEASVSCTV